MPIKEESLKKLESKIHLSRDKQLAATSKPKRFLYKAMTGGYMLAHEISRDDLTIRAQSLSYFTLFSILPLLAGIFLLLGFFSQFSPVQQQFQDLIGRMLESIPGEQRESLLEFMMQFKDNYLAQITAKSASIGIFALVILLWIVVQVFINIEDLMNRIWSVNENRTLTDRIQNFIFCVVILPVIWIATLSLPTLLNHMMGGKWGAILQQGLPTLIMFLGLSFLFKYVPNAQVCWRNAFRGAAFSAVTFLIANIFLRIYFIFGTNTAYGKAAALPIVAFFIYALWMIVIVGAEVSFIAQNKNRFIGRRLPKTTLGEASLLVEMLQYMQKNFETGQSPQSADEMAQHFKVSLSTVINLLQWLIQKGIVGEAVVKKHASNSTYILSSSINHLDLSRVVQDFLELPTIEQDFDVSKVINSISVK